MHHVRRPHTSHRADAANAAIAAIAITAVAAALVLASPAHADGAGGDPAPAALVATAPVAAPPPATPVLGPTIGGAVGAGVGMGLFGISAFAISKLGASAQGFDAD